MGGPKKAWMRESSTDWSDEVELLRTILKECDLGEDVKWGSYCYTTSDDTGGESNVAIIQKMKGELCLMFFRGVLLKDAKALLRPPGENSNHGRRFEFHSADGILELRPVIESYVAEAVALHKAGVQTPKVEKTLELVAELVDAFQRDPSFRDAFNALTPGRQRGYSLFFSAAKSSEARQRRIAKYEGHIRAGKGMHDR